jgi:hypothetical protein
MLKEKKRLRIRRFWNIIYLKHGIKDKTAFYLITFETILRSSINFGYTNDLRLYSRIENLIIYYLIYFE